MAESYVYLNRFNSTGSLALSKKVFLSLGEHALRTVKDVLKRKNDEEAVDLKNEVKVDIRNNRVFYKFTLEAGKDVDAEIIKDNIENIITTNLLMVCDVVPFEIDIKVKQEK